MGVEPKQVRTNVAERSPAEATDTAEAIPTEHQWFFPASNRSRDEISNCATNMNNGVSGPWIVTHKAPVQHHLKRSNNTVQSRLFSPDKKWCKTPAHMQNKPPRKFGPATNLEWTRMTNAES